jgi:type II secretory pathway pseudopilin PulG
MIYPLEPRTDGKAVASMVLGFLFFSWAAAIAAVILGHISRGEIRRSAGRLQGSGMALTGLIFGYLGVSFLPMLILAAILIPNFAGASRVANEVSAIAALRSYNQAMLTYSAQYPSIGFPATLQALGPPANGARPSSSAAGLLDRALACPQTVCVRSGYAFGLRYADGTSFVITATPLRTGGAGGRYLFIDESGVIRYNRTGPADASDSPL